MKHAYLILAHGQWELLRMLISAIDDERNDIYVHIDAKVRELPALHTRKAGLHILEKRVDVRWGDVSQIEAEYALFEAAHECGGYSYYHLLSGADLPIKSQNHIHEFFDMHSGKEFIGYTELEPSAETIRKVCRWHLFPKRFKSESLLVRGPRAVCLRFQELLGIYRNRDISIKKGSQWVSITPELVRILLERKEWALKAFRGTFCPDEIFIQTICWDSPLRTNIFSIEDDGGGCRRAIGWKDGCLHDWSVGDYETLKNSEALFARKFNLKDSGFLMKVMDLTK